MPIAKDSTPPPMIGKIGRYTVFITPPSTPKPSVPAPVSVPSTPPPNKIVPPPVQPPPQQFDKPVPSNGSVLGFFRDAMAKVQNVHSTLDEHLARWFGLDHSKYQWALDDYYESKGVEKEDAKAKEISSKVQSV
ncbi:hypothetical protein L1049_022489 [Liquidambar formosana]|uniref:Hydroxyproline-rich glycoprotein family protein n=1 Tax=Liquidambar formosana TaxID=63359 RepID=A0AAP0WNV5_LIQFO